MKEVKAYQSIDGSIHPTRLIALENDHFFELRAFFQEENQRSDTMTFTHAAKSISKKRDSLMTLLQKQKKELNLAISLANRAQKNTKSEVVLVPTSRK